MKMRRSILLISALFVVTSLGIAALLAVSSTSAQTTTTGNIEGTVVDVNGAAVPGITVSASRAGGGGSASAKTNDEGLFRLMIPPGKYTVRVEAAKGFAGFEQQNVEVSLSRTTNLTLRLQPAGVSGPVTVTPEPGTATTPTAKVSSTTNGGLHTVTFDTSHGQVKVILPDDLRAGDTISGTVMAEPRGETPDERARNLNELKSKAFEIKDFSFGVENPTIIGSAANGADKIPISNDVQPFILNVPHVTSRTPAAKIAIRFLLVDPKSDDNNMPPMFEIKDFSFGVENPTTIGSATGGSAGRPSVSDFKIPALGQQGRPLEIFGPFDGNASNTTVRFGPVGSTVPDFEKNTENVSGGFGLIRPLAESPRKLVFESPGNVTGPVTILVKEGDGTPTTGPYRNVGVQLSAPKTNLMRGEKTIVTIEVSGLAGIIKDVPLQLDSKGVITMEGGSFQNLRIKPEEVKLDGRYTTTREITGVQTGGFNVTATVIVGPFDLCLQDDTDPNRLFRFNSFTGDYVFACGGGSCRPGGGGTVGTQSQGTQSQGTQIAGTGSQPSGSAGTPPPVTLTGTGKPQMKGCIITLSHNAPDRRVFARLDACTKSGDASVETKSPKANFNITDKNTTDNTVASPPPK